MSSPSQELERSFRSVVLALDQMPAEQTQDFLARLVLVLAHELGDAARFQQAVERALVEGAT